MDGVEPRQLLCAFTIPKLKTTVLLPALEGLAAKNIIQNATSYFIKSVLSQSSKDSPKLKNKNVNFILEQQKSFLSCFSENFELSASDFNKVRTEKKAFIKFDTNGSFIPYYNFPIKKKKKDLRETFTKDTIQQNLFSQRRLVPVAGKEASSDSSDYSDYSDSSDSSDEQETSDRNCPFQFTNASEACTTVCFVPKIIYPIVILFFAHMCFNTYLLKADPFNDIPLLDYTSDELLDILMDLDSECLQAETGWEFKHLWGNKEESNTPSNTREKLERIKTFIESEDSDRFMMLKRINPSLAKKLSDNAVKRTKLLMSIKNRIAEEESTEKVTSFDSFFYLFVPNKYGQYPWFMVLEKTLLAIFGDNSIFNDMIEKKEQFFDLADSTTDSSVKLKAKQSVLLIYCHFISNIFTSSYLFFSMGKIVIKQGNASYDDDISEFLINCYLWYFTRNVLPFLSLNKEQSFAAGSTQKIIEVTGNTIANTLQAYTEWWFPNATFDFLRNPYKFDIFTVEYVDLLNDQNAFEQYLGQLFLITGVWYVKDFSVGLGKIFFQDKKSYNEILQLFLPRFPAYLILYLQTKFTMFPKFTRTSSLYIAYFLIYQFSLPILSAKGFGPIFKIGKGLTAAFKYALRKKGNESSNEDALERVKQAIAKQK